MPIVFTTFCIYRIEVYEDENKWIKNFLLNKLVQKLSIFVIFLSPMQVRSKKDGSEKWKWTIRPKVVEF